jgi:hypothetical protein
MVWLVNDRFVAIIRGENMGLADTYDHFSQDYLVDPFPLWLQMR